MWEAFIQHFGMYGNISMVVFQFIIVISDYHLSIPIHFEDSCTGRKNWYDAMWLYIVIQAITIHYLYYCISSALILIKPIKQYMESGYTGLVVEQFIPK